MTEVRKSAAAAGTLSWNGTSYFKGAGVNMAAKIEMVESAHQPPQNSISVTEEC